MPKIEATTRECVIFTDGENFLTMKKRDSIHYLKKMKQDMLVYRKKELFKVKSKGFEMYSFLCSIFEKERGFNPLLRNTYVLSDTLIDKLERYERKLGLSPIFDKEHPNIFFTVTAI